MIKPFAILSIAIFCIYSVNASVVPNQLRSLKMRSFMEAEVMKKQLELKKKHDSDKDPLCKPCIEFFTTLKEIVGDVKNITKDALTQDLELVCKYLGGSNPLIDEICDEFGPAVIDVLYKYLTEVEGNIEPRHDCRLIFLCWGDDASKASAIQQMIIKNKIRLD